MDVRRWRLRSGGLALLLVGGATTVYVIHLWGSGAPVMTAVVGLVALGGAFLLGGREKAFYYLLPVVGVLALLKATGYYLVHGISTLTLLFVLLGVGGIVGGVQAYQTWHKSGET